MHIRSYVPADEDGVVSLWQRCGLTRPWNDPLRDITRKLTSGGELFLVATIDEVIVAAVMAGYDGHRGSINYLAVDPGHRRAGLGRRMMAEVERRLRALGCPKINLQVRQDNAEVLDFYRSIGYVEDAVVSLSRRLERDDLEIRPESDADEATIREVTRQAFEGHPYSSGTEGAIVDALRSEGALTLSLVAVVGDRIVGHVAFSPARPVDGPPGWHALGPVSVVPEYQRQRIGQRMIEAGLDALRQRGAAGCIVLGDTVYYARFGFRRSPAHAPAGVPAEHFMVLPFTPAVPAGAIGFHPAFGVG